MIICTGQSVTHEKRAVCEIRPGQLVVHLSVLPRGTGTLGVSYTHRVVKRLIRRGTSGAWCNKDFYVFADAAQMLPIVGRALGEHDD